MQIKKGGQLLFSKKYQDESLESLQRAVDNFQGKINMGTIVTDNDKKYVYHKYCQNKYFFRPYDEMKVIKKLINKKKVL